MLLIKEWNDIQELTAKLEDMAALLENMFDKQGFWILGVCIKVRKTRQKSIVRRGTINAL